MRQLLLCAVRALYRYYRQDEDSKTAYRSAVIVFSIGPIANIGILCELLGFTDFSGWQLSTDHRLPFIGSLFLIVSLTALGMSRVIPYENVVAESTLLSRPRHDLLITFVYLVSSVFSPLVFLIIRE